MKADTQAAEFDLADVRAAEAVDEALAAAASGVGAGPLREAFGDEGATLAALAGRLAGRLPAPPRADPAFLRALETQLAEAFDARPVASAWRLPHGPVGRLARLALVSAVAAALAAGAFLSGANPLAPHPTEVPTVVAATGTATVATPEARATREPVKVLHAAGRGHGRAGAAPWTRVELRAPAGAWLEAGLHAGTTSGASCRGGPVLAVAHARQPGAWVSVVAESPLGNWSAGIGGSRGGSGSPARASHASRTSAATKIEPAATTTSDGSAAPRASSSACDGLSATRTA